MQCASSDMRTCSAAASASENTATGEMFKSRHARMMRTAISPRLAVRILWNTVSYFVLCALYFDSYGFQRHELERFARRPKYQVQSTKYKVQRPTNLRFK